MKKELAAVTVVFFILMSLPAFSEDQLILKTPMDKASYAIGCKIGNDFKRQSVDINPQVLLRGMTDALTGTPKALTEGEMQEVMMTFSQELQTKQREALEKAGAKNKKEGAEFLAKNKLNAGVKVTPSGLQYRVINAGNGDGPKPSDTVTVHYRGTLIDGTEFDSSYKRNEPATFLLSGVIPGWTEGLQLMKPGGKYELFIPSNLAYGERGAGNTIGPDAVLIFSVELISINK